MKRGGENCNYDSINKGNDSIRIENGSYNGIILVLKKTYKKIGIMIIIIIITIIIHTRPSSWPGKNK